LDAVVYFKDPDTCIRYLAAHRWNDGIPVCPTCGSKDVGFIASRRMFQCKTRHPKAQFSIKLGTIFEDSPLGLDKWLPAMWMIASNRNGISSWELHRAVKVTQKTAWFMLHRIRLAMQDEHFGGKLGGEVECDETSIGGKARNMHRDVKARRIHGRGGDGKAIVTAVLQRHGTIRATVVPDRQSASDSVWRPRTPSSKPPRYVSSTSTGPVSRSRSGRTMARRKLCSHVHAVL